MTYLSFLTGTGHILIVDPRRQDFLFWVIQDGQIAEMRLRERDRPFEKYRVTRLRGKISQVEYQIRITRSAQKELDRLDRSAFGKLDAGLLRLAKRPKPARSKPKGFRWFLGDLRVLVVADYSVVYAIDEGTKRLRILGIGFCRKYTCRK